MAGEASDFVRWASHCGRVRSRVFQGVWVAEKGRALAWTQRFPGCKMQRHGGGAMAKAKMLTVSCENRPGTLARLARVLGDAKVNVLAFLTTTSGTEGSVQLLVDNVNKGRKALDGAG